MYIHLRETHTAQQQLYKLSKVLEKKVAAANLELFISNSFNGKLFEHIWNRWRSWRKSLLLFWYFDRYQNNSLFAFTICFAIIEIIEFITISVLIYYNLGNLETNGFERIQLYEHTHYTALTFYFFRTPKI